MDRAALSCRAFDHPCSPGRWSPVHCGSVFERLQVIAEDLASDTKTYCPPLDEGIRIVSSVSAGLYRSACYAQACPRGRVNQCRYPQVLKHCSKRDLATAPTDDLANQPVGFKTFCRGAWGLGSASTVHSMRRTQIGSARAQSHVTERKGYHAMPATTYTNAAI